MFPRSKIKRLYRTLWGKKIKNMRTNIASDDQHKNDISNYVNNQYIDDHIFDGANNQLIHNSINKESDVNDLIKKAEIDSQLFSKSLVINKMPEIPFNIQLLKTETKNGKLYAEMSDSIISSDFVISKMYFEIHILNTWKIRDVFLREILKRRLIFFLQV